jgi:hypothetical protein
MARRVALLWYLRMDCARAKALFGDLPQTYEVWLARASRWERHCHAQGQAVSRVVVRPGEFCAWCREQRGRTGSQGPHRLHFQRAWDPMRR